MVKPLLKYAKSYEISVLFFSKGFQISILQIRAGSVADFPFRHHDFVGFEVCF